ncbi:uncharacterized protein EAF02_003787 [Botrytis sinoallii]|uniref:Uncharacterized protein n=1 Tax=Botrytis deweyae TaxID=2478750 RepID=A0ABQ7IRC5_9HELO|nr:uncharacterized protein EAF02_003787 [Botrytis sinoallii]XP_038811671.1 uncharacterized protein EAE98_004515 [Botrytis deweyae]KAF7887140.1 hypothetical protein EAF02_003787 [Botrytis sinoallii]KAF7931779.1 hypothetical protein EAE98_004515 [Botrytis deweyae]KAF7939418.1 hypothetical protein EAE99_001223 [Botrytis elliptica]
MQRNARFGFMRYSQGNGPGPTVGHRDPASRHHCHIRLVLVTIADLMAMNYKIQNTTLENYVLGANKEMGVKIVS